jgi:hypothetical protein
MKANITERYPREMAAYRRTSRTLPALAAGLRSENRRLPALLTKRSL